MAAGAGGRPAPRWLKALAEPLSAAQLRRLEEHRYSAAGVSLLEPPLQIYWTWLLQWIPLWMAPNSITLLGLAINLLTTLLLISYCPTATEEVGPAFRSRPARGASAAEEGPPTAVPGTPRSQSQPRPSAQLSRRWRRPGSGETPARMTLPGRGGGQTQPLPRAASATETPAGRLEAVAPLPQVRVYPELPRAAEGLSRSLPQPGSTPASPGH